MRLSSFFSNSAGILLSRIFGFVRDLMMASILGANIYSDMFFVAFKLPNLFRRIFAEGAFAQSFIPSFASAKYKSIFAVGVLIFFIIVVSLLAVAVDIFSPQITLLIAPGFMPKEILEASKYVAIQFWYLPIIFVVSFFASLLQYREHFATTAFSTILLNISLILALFLYKEDNRANIVLALSYAVIVGGVMQLIAHIIVAKTKGILKMLKVGFGALPKYLDKTKEDFNRFFTNFIPAIWGNSTTQIMAFLDTILASFLISGSISYLYYANRIFQLPLALFAIALSVAIFPSISKMIKKSDLTSATKQMQKGFWILLFLLSTASVIGIIFAKEIIWLLFERGSFSRNDTLITANILAIYLIGLLPFGLSRLFSLWLYSNHQQLKAAKIATYSLVAYLVVAISLFWRFGVYGLAIANMASGFTTFILLIRAYGWDRFVSMIRLKWVSILILYLALLVTISIPIHNWLWRVVS